MKKFYWLNDGGTEFIGIELLESYPFSNNTCYHGPFDSLKECKEDAVAYYRIDIEHLRSNIAKIKSIKGCHG